MAIPPRRDAEYKRKSQPKGRGREKGVRPGAPRISGKLTLNVDPARTNITPGDRGSVNQLDIRERRALRSKSPRNGTKDHLKTTKTRAPKVTRHQGERIMDDGGAPDITPGDTPQDFDQYTQRKGYKEAGLPGYDNEIMPGHDGHDDEYFEDDAPQMLVEGQWHYLDIVDSGNIADLLPKTQLAALGADAIREYELDDHSRADIVRCYDAAMKKARSVKKQRNYPFQNSSSVQYPLLNVAANQFAARAYPAIIKGADVVKAKVVGEDPDGEKQKRATRISAHMSYQCLEQMPEWEKQMDEMLHHLPLAGTAIRSVFYDENLGRNCSELITLKDFIVNQDTTSLEDCPRYTRVRRFYPYEIEEKIASGFYRDDVDLSIDNDEDKQKEREILEQHRREELDGDGMAEPYVVTIDKLTGEVLRVVASADLETLDAGFDDETEMPVLKFARHEPMYVVYTFMPDPEGGFYGIGLGKLLESHGEAIDTILNQILDAAHLQNAGGGFLGGNVDFGRRREVRTQPGEWRQLKHHGSAIREAIVPHQWAGPSPVLFSALQLLIESGKEIGSIKDVLTGDHSGNMPVGTVMALIEQGLQQFTAIYKRLYRSMKAEYVLLYRLNSLYLADQDYFNFHDFEGAIGRMDYELDSSDVLPASDATAVTSMQRMSKAEFTMQLKGQPHIDSAAVDRRALQAAGIEDIDELFAKGDPQQSQMEAQQAMLMMQKLEAEIAKLKAEAQERQADAMATVENVDIKKAELAMAAFGKGSEMLQRDYDEQKAEMMPQQQQAASVPSFGAF